MSASEGNTWRGRSMCRTIGTILRATLGGSVVITRHANHAITHLKTQFHAVSRKQIGKRVIMHTGFTPADRPTEIHTDRETDKQADKQKDRQTDGQTHRQTDRTGQDRTGQDRQADRQTDRQRVCLEVCLGV